MEILSSNVKGLRRLCLFELPIPINAWEECVHNARKTGTWPLWTGCQRATIPIRLDWAEVSMGNSPYDEIQNRFDECLRRIIHDGDSGATNQTDICYSVGERLTLEKDRDSQR